MYQALYWFLDVRFWEYIISLKILQDQYFPHFWNEDTNWKKSSILPKSMS